MNFACNRTSAPTLPVSACSDVHNMARGDPLKEKLHGDLAALKRTARHSCEPLAWTSEGSGRGRRTSPWYNLDFQNQIYLYLFTFNFRHSTSEIRHTVLSKRAETIQTRNFTWRLLRKTGSVSEAVLRRNWWWKVNPFYEIDPPNITLPNGVNQFVSKGLVNFVQLIPLRKKTRVQALL